MGLVLKMEKGGTRTNGLKEKKLMWLHMALRPRCDVDCFLKEGGRRLPNIEDCVEEPGQGFDDYVKKSKERANYSSQKRHR